MMQRLIGANRSWRWPSPIVEAFLGFAVLCWAIWLGGVSILIALIAWFSEVDGSVAVPASGLAFWFFGMYAGYLYHDVFATWIANGRTRFDAAIEIGMLIGVIVIAITALATVTVLVEWVVYRIAGWPTALSGDGVYDERARIDLFTMPLLIAGATWAAAGALVGAAWYRWQVWGLVMLVPATLMLSFASNVSRGPVTFDGNMLDWLSVPVVAGLLLCIVGTGILAALLWAVVRGTPVRRKA